MGGKSNGCSSKNHSRTKRFNHVDDRRDDRWAPVADLSPFRIKERKSQLLRALLHNPYPAIEAIDRYFDLLSDKEKAYRKPITDLEEGITEGGITIGTSPAKEKPKARKRKEISLFQEKART